MCGNNIKRAIHSSKAPAAVGPYSHAFQAGDFYYVSGQLGLDANTGELVSGGVAQEVRMALENLGAVLHSAGLDYSHVVKTTLFTTDLKDFGQINTIYADYFPSNPPARSCVQVAALPKDAKFEIEVIAYDDHSHYYMGQQQAHVHTHADGTTHSHSHEGHEGHVHTHADGTVHSHD